VGAIASLIITHHQEMLVPVMGTSGILAVIAYLILYQTWREVRTTLEK
jgi:DHA1 family bicyclomycin/chloramphenicol resistance-like MFS transporter